MRDLINLIESTLMESVTFYPSEMTDTEDGKMVGVPEKYVIWTDEECPYCDGQGSFMQDGERVTCGGCNGQGVHKSYDWDVPQLNVANRNAEVIAEILGTGEGDFGWIEPNDIPNVKRRLIRLMNGEVDHLVIDPSDERGPRRVDRSGDIPRITTGPQMIDFGLSEEQIRGYISRLMPILDFAQKQGLGVSWA
jgi:hypothetical protein